MVTTSWDGTVVRWERERDDDEDVPISGTAGGQKFRRRKGRRLASPRGDDFSD